jgi:hypothetical protein
MKKIVLLAVLALTLVCIQNCVGQCYAPPGPDSNEERVFGQSACGGVSDNPPNPSVFSIEDSNDYQNRYLPLESS